MKHLSRSAVLAIVALLEFSFLTMAQAQNQAVDALYMSAAKVATNIASVHTYPEPPASFNPLTASDVELATYGFPTRPDKQADPNHYAMWERAMLAARNRWRGELKALPPVHRVTADSATMPETSITPAVATQAVNLEASGVLLNNALKTWSSTASFNDIWSVITVPVVQLPFARGSCTDVSYLSMSLVGIDGFVLYSPATGNPLFEPEEAAGVFQGIDCFTPTTFWSQAIFGWEDNYAAAFNLNPGDQFYTELHAFGGCNYGSAFIEDLTTLTYNSYTIANPCTLKQAGHSAYWIVERPPYGQVLDGESPLANTIDISFDGAEVLNASRKPFYPGSQATTTWVLTMHDDNNTQPIELVNQGSSGYQGQHSLWFNTTGCAFSGGCTP